MNIFRFFHGKHKPDIELFFFRSNRLKNDDGSLSNHLDESGKNHHGECEGRVYETDLKWLASQEAQIIPQLLPFPFVDWLWKMISPVEISHSVEYPEQDQTDSMEHLFKSMRESMENAAAGTSTKAKKPKPPKEKRIIIEVHGVFNSSNYGRNNAALVAHATRYLNPVVIHYDWATRGAFPINYNGDCQRRRFSVPQFAEFLLAVYRAFPDCTIDIIAHSQGCDLVMEAMSKFELLLWQAGIKTIDKPLAKKPVRSIILIAADIWKLVFLSVQWDSANANCQNIYSVGSKGDQILKVGNWVDMGWVDRFEGAIPKALQKIWKINIDRYDRLGLGFPVAPGLKCVDATTVDDKLVGHLFAIMIAAHILISIMLGKSLDNFEGYTKDKDRPDDSPLWVIARALRGKLSKVEFDQSILALVERPATAPADQDRNKKR